MFSGIIQATGRVIHNQTLKVDGNCLRLQTDAQFAQQSAVGESVAVQGVCLTITSVAQDSTCGCELSFIVSAHTLAHSSLGYLTVGDSVNLEPSLALGDKLGGHLVYGHVDTRSPIIRYDQSGDNWQLVIRCARKDAALLCPRGSIAIDGISLTIAQLTQTKAGVNVSMVIVPHTHRSTILNQYRVGTMVNVEFDMLARYVARQSNILQYEQDAQ